MLTQLSNFGVAFWPLGPRAVCLDLGPPIWSPTRCPCVSGHCGKTSPVQRRISRHGFLGWKTRLGTPHPKKKLWIGSRHDENALFELLICLHVHDHSSGNPGKILRTRICSWTKNLQTLDTVHIYIYIRNETLPKKQSSFPLMFVKLHWWATTQDWGIWRPSQIPNHHLKFNSWILLHGTAAWLDATQAFLPWLPWQVGKPFGNKTINEPRWPSCGFFLSNVSKVPIPLAEIPEVETLWPESLQVELSFCNFWVHNWAIMSSCCHHIPWVAIVRHSRCKRGRSQGALFSGCEIVRFFLAYLCFSHLCRGT